MGTLTCIPLESLRVRPSRWTRNRTVRRYWQDERTARASRKARHSRTSIRTSSVPISPARIWRPISSASRGGCKPKVTEARHGGACPAPSSRLLKSHGNWQGWSLVLPRRDERPRERRVRPQGRKAWLQGALDPRGRRTRAVRARRLSSEPHRKAHARDRKREHLCARCDDDGGGG